MLNRRPKQARCVPFDFAQGTSRNRMKFLMFMSFDLREEFFRKDICCVSFLTKNAIFFDIATRQT